jgi:hypothetical protein
LAFRLGGRGELRIGGDEQAQSLGLAGAEPVHQVMQIVIVVRGCHVTSLRLGTSQRPDTARWSVSRGGRGKSQTKSQRPQAPGHIQPHAAMIGEVGRHVRPRPAASSHKKHAPYKRGVTGSIPVAPTDGRRPGQHTGLGLSRRVSRSSDRHLTVAVDVDRRHLDQRLAVGGTSVERNVGGC